MGRGLGGDGGGRRGGFLGGDDGSRDGSAGRRRLLRCRGRHRSGRRPVGGRRRLYGRPVGRCRHRVLDRRRGRPGAGLAVGRGAVGVGIVEGLGVFRHGRPGQLEVALVGGRVAHAVRSGPKLEVTVGRGAALPGPARRRPRQLEVTVGGDGATCDRAGGPQFEVAVPVPRALRCRHRHRLVRRGCRPVRPARGLLRSRSVPPLRLRGLPLVHVLLPARCRPMLE